MDQKLLDLSYIESKLQEAPYEPALGIRLTRLSSIQIARKEITFVAVFVDPGKQLISHLHEIDEEICFPLSEGVLRLGIAKKMKTEAIKRIKTKKLL